MMTINVNFFDAFQRWKSPSPVQSGLKAAPHGNRPTLRVLIGFRLATLMIVTSPEIQLVE